MISADEALDLVLRATTRLAAHEVPIIDSVGFIVAEDVVAPDPHPSYRASVKVRIITLTFSPSWPLSGVLSDLSFD